MPRQQRTSTPRRSFNPATRPDFSTIGWMPIGISGNDVQFQISQDTGTLVRKGVPQIRCMSTDETPTTIVYSGSIFTITYTTPPGATDTFHLEANDPAIRNFNGGYLAPGTQQFGNPTPPPPGTVFAPYCAGTDLRGAIADGAGGTSDGLVSADSPGCGFTCPAPEDWRLSETNVDDNLTEGDVKKITGGTNQNIQDGNTVGFSSAIINVTGAGDINLDGSGGPWTIPDQQVLVLTWNGSTWDSQGPI